MDTLFVGGDYKTNLATQQARDRYDADHFPVTSAAARLAALRRFKGLPADVLMELAFELLSPQSVGSNQVNK